MRTARNKDLANLKAQCYAHVMTFEEAFSVVIKAFLCVAQNSDFSWNCDEVKIVCEKGNKVRVFFGSTEQCSDRSGSYDSGTGPHITMVVVVSASGRKAPPFFVKGKNVMSAWAQPLPLDTAKVPNDFAKFCRADWIPGDACIVTSENGSMTKALMLVSMKHLDRAACSKGSAPGPKERRPFFLMDTGIEMA